MIRFKYSFNTIEKFLKQYVKDYRVLTSGELAINSPFTSDTTYDLRINIDKQCWNDWESKESGKIEKLVAVICKTSEEDARKILMRLGPRLVDNTPREKPKPIVLHPIDLPPNTRDFSKESRKFNPEYHQKAIEFIQSKTITYKQAVKYNLQWTDRYSLMVYEDKKFFFGGRIIIPTYEEGMLVYYQARDFLGKSDRKYVNPPAKLQPRKSIVPFYDLLESNKALFISEGPWEAIAYSGTYMQGSVISDLQIEKIKRKNPTAIYIIPDNDETGSNTLPENAKKLLAHMSCPIYIVKWWEGRFAQYKDPTDGHITFDDIINSTIIKVDKLIDLKIKAGLLRSGQNKED